MVLSQNYAKLAVLPHNILLEEGNFCSFTKRPPFLCLSCYPLGALYIFQQTKMLLPQGIKEELISPFAIHHSMLQFSEIFKSRAVIQGTTSFTPAFIPCSHHTGTHSHRLSAGFLHQQSSNVFYFSSQQVLVSFEIFEYT